MVNEFHELMEIIRTRESTLLCGTYVYRMAALATLIIIILTFTCLCKLMSMAARKLG